MKPAFMILGQRRILCAFIKGTLFCGGVLNVFLSSPAGCAGDGAWQRSAAKLLGMSGWPCGFRKGSCELIN